MIKGIMLKLACFNFSNVRICLFSLLNVFGFTTVCYHDKSQNVSTEHSLSHSFVFHEIFTHTMQNCLEATKE